MWLESLLITASVCRVYKMYTLHCIHIFYILSFTVIQMQCHFSALLHKTLNASFYSLCKDTPPVRFFPFVPRMTLYPGLIVHLFSWFIAILRLLFSNICRISS